MIARHFMHVSTLYMILARISFTLSSYGLHVALAYFITDIKDYGRLGVIFGMMSITRVLLSTGIPQATSREIAAREEHSASYGDYRTKVLGPGDDLESCAGELFHILREFDSENTDVIIAEAVEEKGLGLAIMNRLRKAAVS